MQIPDYGEYFGYLLPDPQLLGLKRRFMRPPDKTKGIISTAPNHFLHVDTTFLPLPDGTKAAIVFVSDNFSKHILGWACSLKHSAQNVIEALQMTMQTIRTYHPQQLVSLLVSDGGSENNALSVEEWLEITEDPKYSQKAISMDFSEQTRLARTQRTVLNKVQGCKTCN